MFRSTAGNFQNPRFFPLLGNRTQKRLKFDDRNTPDSCGDFTGVAWINRPGLIRLVVGCAGRIQNRNIQRAMYRPRLKYETPSIGERFGSLEVVSGLLSGHGRQRYVNVRCEHGRIYPRLVRRLYKENRGACRRCVALGLIATLRSESVDYTGCLFGNLLVKSFAGYRKLSSGKRCACWNCICQCEKQTQKIVWSANLRNGNTKSCGCLRGKKRIGSRRDLTGMKFGKLTVLRFAGYMQHGIKKLSNVGFWECECDCIDKTHVTVSSGNLTNHHWGKGRTSCGCISRARSAKAKAEKSRPEIRVVDGVAMHAKTKDLTGRKFNKLTVVRFGGYFERGGREIGKSSAYWVCRCDCGESAERLISSRALLAGNTVGCPQCAQRRRLATVHRFYRTTARCLICRAPVTIYRNQRYTAMCQKHSDTGFKKIIADLLERSVINEIELQISADRVARDKRNRTRIHASASRAVE